MEEERVENEALGRRHNARKKQFHWKLADDLVLIRTVLKEKPFTQRQGLGKCGGDCQPLPGYFR